MDSTAAQPNIEDSAKRLYEELYEVPEVETIGYNEKELIIYLNQPQVSLFFMKKYLEFDGYRISIEYMGSIEPAGNKAEAVQTARQPITINFVKYLYFAIQARYAELLEDEEKEDDFTEIASDIWELLTQDEREVLKSRTGMTQTCQDVINKLNGIVDKVGKTLELTEYM